MNQNLGFKIAASVTGQNQVLALSGAVGKATTALKALAGAFAIREGVQFVKSIINIGDELKVASQAAGVSVSQLSKLRTAAELSDVSFSSLETSLKKLNVNLADAANGNEKAQARLKALNVTAKDAGGALSQIADRFAKMEDGPQKAALAVDLFGKSGTEMIAMLNEGGEALDKFGLNIDDDFAQKADAFNDALVIMKLNFQNVALTVATNTMPVLKNFIEELSKIGGGKFWDNLSKGASAFFTFFTQGVDMLIAGVRKLVNTMVYAGANISDYVGTIVSKNFSLKYSDFKGLSDRKDQRFIQLQKENMGIDEGLMDRTGRRVDALREVFNPTPADAIKRTGAVPNAGALTDDSLVKKIERERDAVKKYELAQREAIEIRQAELDAVNESNLEHEKRIDLMKTQYDVAKATVGFENETAIAYRNAAQAALEERAALMDKAEAQRKSFGQGAKQALKDYVEAAKDSATQMKNVFETAFKGLEDSLLSFVKTGKMNLADLANSISDMLIRIAIQKAIAGAISAAGFADGGIMSSSGPMPLKKYASGGIANSPQLALFGEGRMPEAYVPLPDGRSIPVTMKGAGGGGGDTNISVVVNVESGQENVQAADQKGKELGSIMVNVVRQELIKQKRPGGLLA